MLHRLALLSVVLLISKFIFSQHTYPQDYFRSPIDYTPSLSGAFGEIRTGHFHSGIDYRTQGVEGKPVYAIAEGFISRISISPTGFGKAIYVDHPNGFTSVYAHIRNFPQPIQEYILREQYRRESFRVDLYPEPHGMKVTKGEVIAYSGNSGSSSGPHIHFEIRHTHNQNPINPLLFDLKIKDNIPPVIQNLKIYPADEFAVINGRNQEALLELNGANGKYWLTKDVPVLAGGRVYFAIQAYDTHNFSKLRNGISSMKVFINNSEVFSYSINEFAFADTRYVLAVLDYAEFIRTKRRFIQTRILPNNKIRLFTHDGNNGVFTFSQPGNYAIRIEAGDNSGNISTLNFRITATETLDYPVLAKENNNKKLFRFSQFNRFQSEDVYVEMPKGVLYDDIWFEFAKETAGTSNLLTDIFHIHNIYTPAHRSFTLAIKAGSLDPALRTKAILVRQNGDGEWVSEGGTFSDGHVITETRTFGLYSVMVDTIAPEIRPANISSRTNISKQNDIRIRISDKLSGIKTYRATMNGQWILMDWDPKNDLLVYEIDERTTAGENRFKLIVEDNTGNTSQYEAVLFR
jgi:hypothetical protein